MIFKAYPSHCLTRSMARLVVWHILSLFLLCQQHNHAMATHRYTADNNHGNDNPNPATGTDLTPTKIGGIFEPSALLPRQGPPATPWNPPVCGTGDSRPKYGDMREAYIDFLENHGKLCGASEKAPIDANGMQTIVWKQSNCAGLGIHCKAGAQYNCSDIWHFFDKILGACTVEKRCSGTQDVASLNYGTSDLVWMLNVCEGFWMPPW